MATKKNVSSYSVKRLKALAAGTQKAADYWASKVKAKEKAGKKKLVVGYS